MRGEQHAHAKGARLFQHAEHGLFGGRVGGGRHVAENFIHVDEGAQAGGTGLRTHPGFDRGEEQCDEEHALRVAQVRNVEYAVTRAAILGKQQCGDVEALSLAPDLEAGRGQDVVEQHRQFHAVFGRKEGIKRERAQFVEGRSLSLQDEFGQVEVFALTPGSLKKIGEQDMFTRAERVHVIHADQPEDGGDGAGNTFAQNFAVALPRNGRRAQRRQHTDGNARVRAGRVNGKLGRVLQSQQAFTVNAPFAESFLPHFGGFLRGGFEGLARAADNVRVQPGLEVLRREFRKVQEQVGQVAFGVNNDGGDILEGGLFEDANAQAGLARAGHAGDESVRSQVGGIVEDGLVRKFVFGSVEQAAEKKVTLCVEHKSLRVKMAV